MPEAGAPTVVVTGANGGLGSALTADLRDVGYKVVGVDLKEISETSCDHVITGDVSTEAVWMEVARHSYANQVNLRGLVNCAGQSTRTDLENTTFDDWNRVLGSNLTATWLGMKSCLPALAAAGGAIVNVGSMYGRLPPPRPPNPPSSPAYQAAKAGIVALTRTAASEFADRGVRVNCVEPGLFATSLTNDLPDEAFETRMRNVALGRCGEPRELTRVVRFLLSDDASYITGESIAVDGGYPLWL